jgi:poly-gamma-glutamate capsule biosynthesis protein CapA/YwtB (metallophosphatase superfamily)
MAASILAVGDMMFDTRLRGPRVFYHKPEIATCVPDLESLFSVPYVNCAESRQWLVRRGFSTHGIDLTAHASQSTPLAALDAAADYPFRAIAGELRSADIVFGNLECPLSSRGRPMANDQCYCAPPEFAASLAAAPFHVVSFANNHCMDYGDAAFLDTLDVLGRHGVAVIGAGPSLSQARKPALFDVGGVRIAFLGYTMVGAERTFAIDGECGAVPLNTFVAAQDITAVRLDVDIVVLSVHWGAEMVAAPSPRLVEFAHQLVDAGADVIIGHHPHVPGSIEVYRGRPILYSLGNFCFGHDHGYWGDNMMVRLIVEAGGVRSIEVIPLAGGPAARYQPAVLTNGSLARFRDQIGVLSALFGTPLEWRSDGRGSVRVSGS